MPALTADDVQRYKRHLVMREVGGPGQQKLKGARVLIVGAGGLGSPAALYLAAAGVGTIGLVDDDKVSIDNLQRQILYRTADAGRSKVLSAEEALGALNPLIAVEAHDVRLRPDNALALVSRYDIVADGSDNFATRYLLADACHFAKKPLVYAALGQFDGYATTIKSYEKTARGTPNPTLRCVFPEPPPQGSVAPCSEAGVLGPVAGVLGALQAAEVIKEILGLGESLVGHLLIYDAVATRFEKLKVQWDPDNPLTGRSPTITSLAIHASTDGQSCAAE